MTSPTSPAATEFRSGLSAALVAIPEIARLTVRQLLGRRRTLLLVLMAALPILLAVIVRIANNANESATRTFVNDIFNGVALTIVLPLTAVLFGTGAFGTENDEGTIVYLLAKPIPRWAVIAAKAVSAAVLALVLTVASVVISGFIALSSAEGSTATDVVWASVIAMVVGSLCYIAVFIPLSLFTRRALVIGIGYVLVWEGALSALLPGIANLSIRQYALGAASSVYTLSPTPPARVASETAFLLAAIVIVASLVIATWRLRRFELPGGD